MDVSLICCLFFLPFDSLSLRFSFAGVTTEVVDGPCCASLLEAILVEYAGMLLCYKWKSPSQFRMWNTKCAQSVFCFCARFFTVKNIGCRWANECTLKIISSCRSHECALKRISCFFIDEIVALVTVDGGIVIFSMVLLESES